MIKHYGIIGRSPEVPLFFAMHQAAFKAEKVEAEYQIFDIDPLDPEALANFCYESDLNQIEAFSVSPHYQASIMDYLDHYDPLAKKVGFATTIRNQASNLEGYNTTVTAILKALQEKTKLIGKKALILGAGDVAAAAVYGLKEYAVEVYLWNRTPQKAEALASEFEIETIEFREIPQAQFDLIINTTPVGNAKHLDQSLLTAEQIKPGAIVLDLNFSPLPTRLLKEAARAEAQSIGGDRVLLHQAAGEFEIWFEKTAPVEAMEEALKQHILK